jgi:hypothetical protein
MMKITQKDAFWKAQKKHKHLGFDGMVFLAYVAEFEAQGLRCFVSRATIAEELPISESGARYLIQRLVTAGCLFVRYEGRKRYLSTTKEGGTIKPDQVTKGANSAPKGGTIKPIEGAELNQMRGHERTTTKNQYKESLQRNNYKENTNISKLIYKPKSNSKPSKNLDLESEFRDPEYQEFKKRLLAGKAESPKRSIDELPD